jgi:transposase-like protein
VTKRRIPQTVGTPPTPANVPSEPRAGRRPQDWTDDEKIAAVLESMSLTEEQLGGFLRQRGLYRATLDEWRKAMLRGAKAELGGRASKGEKKARAADAKRIRTLERELVRKDKALAEAAALLVLRIPAIVSAQIADRDHLIAHGGRSEATLFGGQCAVGDISLRRDGPFSTIRWHLERRRSQIASAVVGSPI